ncbi:NAD-dependent deacetylase hst3 [Coemansia sp. RSA 1199]|nr:NAD-dependent deacetylase hst3 [Coemansia sp. RSA 1199]
MQRLILSELEESGSETASRLAKVQRAVQASQRCLVITGAGISVSSGIPDFRSPDGLFQQLKQKYPSSVTNGRDLFDATLFHDASMVNVFYSFMGELRTLIDQATCTPTHAFIKQLDEHGKLLRCYTQNIDSLEKRVGLETAFVQCEDTGDKTDSTDSASKRRKQAMDKKFTRAVQLHGDLDTLICTICHTRCPFSHKLAQEFREGTPPPCPRCKEVEEIRGIVGKRSQTTGVLRPDIVLYNEMHPQGELIGSLNEYDLKRRPDLLIVIGTSLKIPGIKRMIREMSRCVHDSAQRTQRAGAGKVIFINRDEPPRGWNDVFDYFIEGDADQAVSLLPIHGDKLALHDESSSSSAESTQDAMSIPRICNPAMSIDRICNPPVDRVLEAKATAKRPSKPLSSILPPARVSGLRKRGSGKAPSRKITSMMKVVKSTTVAKPKLPDALRRSQRTRQRASNISPLVPS